MGAVLAALPAAGRRSDPLASGAPPTDGGAGNLMRTDSRTFPMSARWLVSHRLALWVLAGAGALSVLCYWAFFVRPFSLPDLAGRPLQDLVKLSQADPAARPRVIAGYLVLGGLYWLGWRAAQRIDRKDRRAAWIVIIASALVGGGLLLFMYPFGAADLFDNIMHGRILGIYGANPFAEPAAQFSTDPIYRYTAWRRSTSAYGPAWEVLAGGTAWLVDQILGSSETPRVFVVGNAVAFKLLSGAFLAASAAVVTLILRRKAPERALAGVVLLAWNPVILVETLGNGHNDIAMIFWVLAAAWALVGGRYTLAMLALVVGALVKFVPVLMLPAALLVAWRELGERRRGAEGQRDRGAEEQRGGGAEGMNGIEGKEGERGGKRRRGEREGERERGRGGRKRKSCNTHHASRITHHVSRFTRHASPPLSGPHRPGRDSADRAVLCALLAGCRDVEHRAAAGAVYVVAARRGLGGPGAIPGQGAGRSAGQRGRPGADGPLCAVAGCAGLARPELAGLHPRVFPHRHVLPAHHLPLVPKLVCRLASGIGGASAARPCGPAGGALRLRGVGQAAVLRAAVAVAASPAAQGVARAAHRPCVDGAADRVCDGGVGGWKSQKGKDGKWGKQGNGRVGESWLKLHSPLTTRHPPPVTSTRCWWLPSGPHRVAPRHG
ncbi:MAG: hypothetical protein R2844_20000 [Caldilineales bacterium]